MVVNRKHHLLRLFLYGVYTFWTIIIIARFGQYLYDLRHRFAANADLKHRFLTAKPRNVFPKTLISFWKQTSSQYVRV